MFFLLIFLVSRFVQGQPPIGKIVMKRTLDHLCLYKEALLHTLIGTAYHIYVSNFYFVYAMITDPQVNKLK